MSSDFYPQGSIAMGNGDLVDVYDITLDLTDNSKQISTLRKRGAGITQGQEECTVSFSSKIGENGEEADYFQMVKKKVIKQLRIKIPNRTITIEGKYKDISLGSTVDDAIDLKATFIGHVVD